jgi:hypothetical protein
VRPTTGRGYQEAELYKSTVSLTSALDGGGWSTPRSGRFAPGGDTWYPLYRWLGEPQGTGAGNPAPHRDSMPEPPITQVAIPTELFRPTGSLHTSAIKAVRRIGFRVENQFRRSIRFSSSADHCPGQNTRFLWFLTCAVTLEFQCTAATVFFLPPLLVCYSARNPFPCLVTGANWFLLRTAIPPICPQHSYYK